MKKIKSQWIASILAASVLTISTGCFGEFALTRRVYKWNDGVSDSKFVKSLLFYALCIIPVYEVSGIIDFFILNLVEFWSGSNPLTMEAGEYEHQRIAVDGEEWDVEVTRNQMSFTRVGSDETSVLNFDPELREWSYQAAGQEPVVVCKIVDGPNGELMTQTNTPAGTSIHPIAGPKGHSFFAMK